MTHSPAGPARKSRARIWRARKSAPRPRLGRDAIAIARQAFDEVRRLGHRQFGAEHFLLALAAADHPACAVLRAHGGTPERVEEEIARLAGFGPGAALFADLDADVLAAAGVNLSVVRSTAEGAFSPVALAHAADRVYGKPGRRTRKPARQAGAEEDGYYIPHSPSGIRAVSSAVQRARDSGSAQAGVEHLLLGVISVPDGLVPHILAGLDVSAATLRSAILGR